MRMVDLIVKKRAGEALTREEIQWFIERFSTGNMPDYQVSALMMAIYFQKMTMDETVALVEAMIESGDQIDLSGLPGKKVDKHSTGGVGDKTTLILIPMVAACGAPVAKLSGRGLGHTGGTLDKLESFEGFRVELTLEEIIENVQQYGLAIGSQTQNLVPADKKLYALRDVTGTVENVSLIAGSIMSKKVASGAEGIVLDVKCGSGAFMKTLEAAKELGQKMVDIGTRMGRETVAIVSDMEQPLGNTVGNALEVKEALDSLRGNGPADLMELCYALGEQMLILSGLAANTSDARRQLEAVIANGKALAKMRDLVAAQGGDPVWVDHPEHLPSASHSIELTAPSGGFVQDLAAQVVGESSMLLGAGRETKSSTIDLGAGIVLHKKRGDAVQAGESLAILYANAPEKLVEAAARLGEAYSISPEALQGEFPLIHARITSSKQ